MSAEELILKHLVDRDASGKQCVPGAAVGARLVEADGREIAVIGRGETCEVFFTSPRMKSVMCFECSPRAALRLAFALVWTWWMRGTWCGIKTRLWLWAVEQRELR